MNPQYGPSDIAKRGEEIYFASIQHELEPAHNGEYVVIEVEGGGYTFNANPLLALEEAKQKYPGKLFHVIRVGFISKPTVNYHNFSL